MKKRLRYIPLLFGIVCIGLLSRKLPFLPSWIGDLLYALLMFFLIRFISLYQKTLFVALWSLGICFAIELSQLYQADWINDIRASLAGRLVLGQGFLWRDLLAYTVGVSLGFVLEKTNSK